MGHFLQRSLFIVILFSLSFLGHQSFGQCLSGNYTIGAGGNFTTITQAVSALQNQGICGPVVFKIKDGEYFEKVTLSTISGSSEINTVRFTAESGDRTKVVLKYNDRYEHILKISDASHIVVDNVTFFNETDAGSSVKVEGSQFITFTGIQFSKPVTANGIHLNIYAKFGVPFSTHHVNISENTFTNGNRAIYTLQSSNLQIQNNSINNILREPLKTHN